MELSFFTSTSRACVRGRSQGNSSLNDILDLSRKKKCQKFLSSFKFRSLSKSLLEFQQTKRKCSRYLDIHNPRFSFGGGQLSPESRMGFTYLLKYILKRFIIFRPHNVYGAKQNIWDNI